MLSEESVNVTGDVELWYSGAAENRGWMLTMEDDFYIRLASPSYSNHGSWKLRITYEPADAAK